MSYMFDEFKNIRTMPARTRVHKDGVFAPELSSDNGAGLPLHIIHIGKITGAHNWFVDMSAAENVFLTARLETSGDTKIRLEVNANLSDVEFDGKLIVKNFGALEIEIAGNNNRDNTKIKCETKLFAAADSENRLVGTAVIPANVEGAETDIGFAALCAGKPKFLMMSPRQMISGIPKSAGHSASIFAPKAAEIKYLETAGLSAVQSRELLNQVFMEEII